MPRDDLLTALAEPTRREIVELLRQRPCSVGDLAAATGASQPSTSKHLKVLREAGLVQADRQAQRRVYRLRPEGFAELDAWLAPYRWMWEDRLDALERRLDETDPGRTP